MIPTIRPNEISFAVSHLHIIMKLLQLPVDNKEFQAKKAGPKTRNAVRSWQRQHQIPVNQQLLVDAATATAFARTLQNSGYLEKSQRNTISGKVLKESRDPAQKVTLLAFDLDLKGLGLYKDLKTFKQLLAVKAGFEYLGMARSDENGDYGIAYYDWMFTKGERKRGDIVVFAIQNNKITGKSEFVQNAARTSREINITVEEQKSGKGAYKPMYKSVFSFLKENNLAIQEIETSQDHISFISGELDIPTEHIQQLMLAHLLNNSTNLQLEPELLYGLGMQNIVLNWDSLFRVSNELLKDSLSRAIKEKDIDPFPQNEIDQFIDLLHAAAAQKLLEPSDNLPNPVDELLKLSLKKPEDRILFTTIKNQYRGDDEKEFWENYLPQHSSFSAKIIANLRQNQDLLILTGYHFPVVQELKKTNLRSIQQLVKWTPDQWKEIIKKSGIPDHILGKNKNERTNRYISELQKSINSTYPSAAIQFKIKSRTIDIKNNKVRNSIAKFLSADLEFDIKTSRIKEYEEGIRSITGNDDHTHQLVLQELSAMQRMVRINPDTALIGIMKEEGMTSASYIAEYDRKAFIAEFEDAFGGSEYALEIYDNATYTSTSLMRIITGIRATIDDHMPGIMDRYLDRDMTSELLTEHFPGYSEAFDINLCECQHCNSVYSPAAYFVDLMRYLERGGRKMVENADGTEVEKSPSDIFRERRPDLFHLPLTCENSNTLIPYIDLANEVMENYIFYTEDEALNFENYISEETGEISEPELRAQPQNIQKTTYEIIAGSVFPMTMPFHLPLETLQAYGKQMGTSWHEILRTIHPSPAAPVQAFLNATYLNFSEKDYQILTGKNFNGLDIILNLEDYYGITATPGLSDLDDLRSVSVFLKQTGLHYTELVQLLKTHYINANFDRVQYLDFLFTYSELTAADIYHQLNELFRDDTVTLRSEITDALDTADISETAFRAWIASNFDSVRNLLTLYEPNSSCDLSNTEIRSIQNIYDPTAENLSDSALLKLLRFIRLWRKLGGRMQELDAIISALGYGDARIEHFDPLFIEKLSYAKQLIDVTQLSPIKAATLWGDMGYRVEGNLYAQLFLSKSIEINDVFIPNSSADLFESLSGDNSKLSTYNTDLLAALSITETDLNIIYRDAGVDPETIGSMSIANISIIYRYILFAETCGISVAELVHYMKLFDLHPFVAHDPEPTLLAYNNILQIKESGFSTQELAYIFSEADIDTSTIAITESDILQQKTILAARFSIIDDREVLVPVGEDIEDVRTAMKKEAVIDVLSNFLSLSPGIVEALLEEADIIELTTPPDDITFVNHINGLHRAAITMNHFQFGQSEMAYLIEHKEDFDELDMRNLTNITWWRIYQYVVLRETLPETDNALFDVFKYATTDASADIAGLKVQVRELTLWNPDDIDYLIDELYPRLEDFKNEKVIRQMQNAIQLVRTMGIAVQSFYDFRIETAMTFDDMWSKARHIKKLLKAKYNRKTWIKVATKLNDILREKSRDALMDYLLQMESIKTHELGIRDANGLYEFFLLDVQMSACMETSRIVQASAAIQQFVNRSHLNLEKNVRVDALNRNRWSWMKNYRVWEAQMRVWYENETLLNPEWRMDKSPFFKELESYLTQNDITERTAEEALRAYLKSMDEVANLNISGMYEEKDNDGNLKLLHVFGHTNHTPYTYYYRTYSRYGKWSAWEQVDAAIQPVVNNEDGGKSGVHLIPVVWENRLILFWPEFMEKSEPAPTGTQTFQQLAEEGGSIASQQPKKYWEVRLAWSEYYDKKWIPKQITNNYFNLDKGLFSGGSLNPNSISFNTLLNVEDNYLEVFLTPNIIPRERNWERVIPDNETFGLFNYQSFHFNNIENGSEVQLVEIDLSTNTQIDVFWYWTTTSGLFRNNYLNRYYKYDFNKTNKILKPLVISETFLRNEIEHQLLFPNQLQYHDDPKTYPFFYTSNGKTYFVKQKLNNIIVNSRPSDSEDYGVGFRLPDILRISLPVLSFHTFHHPYVSNIISNLNKNGIGSGDASKPGLLESDISISSSDGIFDDEGEYFRDTFGPDSITVFQPSASGLTNPMNTYFKETIDFDRFGANSRYNWELFYHAPLYIAVQLSKNGRFREAMDWFHFIFDPTTDAPVETGEGSNEMARFFKFKPFKTTPLLEFEKFIDNLPRDGAGGREHNVVKEWRDHPFDPHLVASNFPVNYMKYVILAYVENIVNWGDSLFRKFTRENVYEAIQLYVIAGHVMGPKPQVIPKRGVIKKETYESIRGKLSDLSNFIVSLENGIPYSSDPTGDPEADDSTSLLGIGSAFYFCIPPNEKLLHYWDIVEDRLNKIRNCKDINGIARRLALFAPPIDPAALIKAKSAGLDLETILAGLNTPNPHYRFSYLLQRANEFCSDVKALGAALLSAIEKQEGEELSRIRMTHEVEILQMIRKIKERQILDAKTARELLEKQQETAIYKLNYYNETMLGNEPIEIPSVIELNAELDSDSQVQLNPEIQEVVPDVNVSLSDGGEGVKILGKENEDINKRTAAKALAVVSSGGELVASVAALFPSVDADGKPFGVGAGTTWGGQNIAFGAQLAAKALQTTSAVLNQEAAMASTMASYIRREQDWTHQANLAAKEIVQLERQILMAGIRIQITEKELEQHNKQIENAETIENFLKEKFSNTELYQWMKEQLIHIHKQSYDLAFEMAKKAEMAFEFEKGVDTSDIPLIDYGYFDSSKNGLLAGEKLQLALRHLENSYQEKNKRAFELSKHISLKLLNPEELIRLKETGEGTFNVIEQLFDADLPGHYNRTIRSVALSIPCIIGPNNSVSCTLRLNNSRKRIAPNYDSESLIDLPAVPVTSIATSSGQNDYGLFELNFRDERYLPFEGAGAISEWDIELNSEEDLRLFDYETITDVVMHINYTSLEGPDEFKSDVNSQLRSYYSGLIPLFKEFNIKNDFPSLWFKLQTGERIIPIKIESDHFPFRDKSKNLTIKEISLVTNVADIRLSLAAGPIELSIDTSSADTVPSTIGGLNHWTKITAGVTLPLSTSIEILFDATITKSDGEPFIENELQDLYLILGYSW